MNGLLLVTLRRLVATDPAQVHRVVLENREALITNYRIILSFSYLTCNPSRIAFFLSHLMRSNLLAWMERIF